jgi:hypothetical protein
MTCFVEKSSPRICAKLCIILKNLPKGNNRSIGEKSPNLVTLHSSNRLNYLRTYVRRPRPQGSKIYSKFKATKNC